MVQIKFDLEFNLCTARTLKLAIRAVAPIASFSCKAALSVAFGWKRTSTSGLSRPVPSRMTLSGRPREKLAELPFSGPQKLSCTLTSRPRERSVSKCSRHCSPVPIEIDVSRELIPRFCFAFDGWHKVRGKKVDECPELGSELPARRPQDP